MEDRVTLEEKLAWLERYVLELDGVVRAQADELARLSKEVADLRATRAAPEPTEGTIEYERPPHY